MLIHRRLVLLLVHAGRPLGFFLLVALMRSSCLEDLRVDIWSNSRDIIRSTIEIEVHGGGLGWLFLAVLVSKMECISRGGILVSWS
jgi:hypothetical protein